MICKVPFCAYNLCKENEKQSRRLLPSKILCDQTAEIFRWDSAVILWELSFDVADFLQYNTGQLNKSANDTRCTIRYVNLITERRASAAGFDANRVQRVFALLYGSTHFGGIMMEQNNYLGHEKIWTLLFKFSVPCIFSMVIGALYNIVDQLFIGNSRLGYLGNAATSIVYPITIIVLAFGLMWGDGCDLFEHLSGKERHIPYSLCHRWLHHIFSDCRLNYCCCMRIVCRYNSQCFGRAG